MLTEKGKAGGVLDPVNGEMESQRMGLGMNRRNVSLSRTDRHNTHIYTHTLSHTLTHMHPYLGFSGAVHQELLFSWGPHSSQAEQRRWLLRAECV